MISRLITIALALAFWAVAACSQESDQTTTTRVNGGAQFQDCAGCPDMIVIAAGEFVMGSPPSEQYRGAEMQHRVTIPSPFAVSKFEITFKQWDACVAGGGCGGYVPDDQGWGRGKRPVINVSWDDAKSYVAWLSRKTGQAYRLLSESEWEYAARAGTVTAFIFGEKITPAQANFDDSMGKTSEASDSNRQQTVPVGSFPANAFGLHDVHGNVWEWVEDCWHDEYTPDAPNGGSAWLSEGCGGHVLRGGSWEDYSGDLRSAARVGGNTEDQYYSDGFRIAKTL
jgi:formylglycine-generating enzyme required for sulfatase activity